MGQVAEAFRLLLRQIGPQKPVMVVWVEGFFVDDLGVFQALPPSISPFPFQPFHAVVGRSQKREFCHISGDHDPPEARGAERGLIAAVAVDQMEARAFQRHRLDVCGGITPDGAARGEANAEAVDSLDGVRTVKVYRAGLGSDLANCRAKAGVLLQRKLLG